MELKPMGIKSKISNFHIIFIYKSLGKKKTGDILKLKKRGEKGTKNMKSHIHEIIVP